MSRSGYVDDGGCDYNNAWALNKKSIDRAIQGKRGQDLLHAMAAALDAMPVKELVAEKLVTDEGAVCALGAVAVACKIDVSGLDPEDSDAVAKKFNIAPSLAREIVFQNDDDFGYLGRSGETPAQRWTRIRKWVGEQLTQPEVRHG